jgi:hypothetical protein
MTSEDVETEAPCVATEADNSSLGSCGLRSIVPRLLAEDSGVKCGAP